MITSLQNPRVKAAIKLRVARERRKQERIIIDGSREILRAWQAGVELAEVFVCEELCRSDECRQWLAALAEPVGYGEVRQLTGHRALAPGQSPGLRANSSKRGIELLQVSRDVFAKLAFGERAEGLVGVARMPAASLADLRLPSNPLVAVLEGVEKPGNIGAVLRSADAAGVAALIVADGGTDLYNPNAIRASLGTIFSVSVCAASTQDTILWLAQKQLAIYAAWVDAERDYVAADFTRPCAVVLGSETAGLSDRWRPGASSAIGHEGSITPIKLPMFGVADSLNVSVAAAVLFYEALRQRRLANAQL